MVDMSLFDLYITEASKLNEENYVNWKFKLITLLEALILWLIVKGDEHKPTDPLSLLGLELEGNPSKGVDSYVCKRQHHTSHQKFQNVQRYMGHSERFV